MKNGSRSKIRNAHCVKAKDDEPEKVGLKGGVQKCEVGLAAPALHQKHVVHERRVLMVLSYPHAKSELKHLVAN